MAAEQPLVGKPIKLTGVTLKGSSFDLTSLRGRVVVVDFWATWCPPCRAELPNLKSLHERYNSQGLEVVGVSLDVNQKELSSFVRKANLPWTQLVWQKPGPNPWENPFVSQFRISAIPDTLLINREGSVVARGLVGSGLNAAVERLMADKSTQASKSLSGKPVIPYFAALGWLAGILVERKLRQKSQQPGPGVPT
jgi:thiol-disulfide isomerase/thioredoxin